MMPDTLVLVIATYGAAVLVWLGCIRYLRSPASSTILVIALLSRIASSIPQPGLSNDVYRYLWDGQVTASGRNPYESAPADPRLASLRQTWHPRINHPDIRTIYPPFAQLWFALAAMAGPSVVSWKILLILADILTIIFLLRSFGRSTAFAYSICPVVLVEGFWNAHVDVIAATFLVASCAAIGGARSGLAGWLMSLAAGTKVIPAAAAPAMLALSSNRPRFVFALVVTTLASVLPFLGRDFMPGMRSYATRWVFNSPAYDLASWASSAIGLAERMKGAFIASKDLLHLEAMAPYVYAHAYDDFVARATLALAFVVALVVILRRKQAIALATVSSVGALILCSPAIHPWYWLTLLPLALAARAPLWIAFAACAPFSYLLYAGASKWIVFALCYGLPLLLGWVTRASARAS